MAILIDTSILIVIERRHGTPDDLSGIVGDTPVALASITASELLMGVERADTLARRQRREQFVEHLLRNIQILPFDVQVARVHARIWADSLSRGESIGAHDLIIAATALSYDYSVLTMNRRDFSRVPLLPVVEPNF